MTGIVEFFRQISTPTVQHLEDVQEVRAAVARMQALLDQAREASEQLQRKSYGTFS